MIDKLKQHYIHRSPLQLLLGFLAALLVAAMICTWGCMVIILQGPYTSYRKTLVNLVCRQTPFDLAVKTILGAEEFEVLLDDAQEGSQQ